MLPRPAHERARFASASRWLAAALLAVFAVAQGAAIVHADADAHDHDGACAACRLIDDHGGSVATAAMTGPVVFVAMPQIAGPPARLEAAPFPAQPPSRAPPSA